MSYQPVVLEKFGGLDFRDDPGEVGTAGALRAFNVNVRNGTVSTRPGSTKLVDSITGSYVDGIQSGSFLVMIRSDTVHVRPDIIDHALGRQDVGDFGHNSPPTGLTTYGNPGAQAVYVAFGEGGGWQKVELTGSWAITNLGGAKPYFLAVSPWDNRMVHANYHSASVTTLHASPSTVYFSRPGQPTGFGDNDYVLLHPGDGEEIRAMVTWRDFVIVFKESTMYVFTTPAQNPQGEPIFPYRAVPLGTRLDTAALDHRTAVAGPDGVYFVTIDGIYRTDGFNVERISTPLDPAWTRTSALRDDEDCPDHGNAFGFLSYYQDRLFYRYVNLHGNARMFVWDRQENAWTNWSTTDLATVPISWVRDAGGESLWVGRGPGLYRYEPQTLTDNGLSLSGEYETCPQILANGEIATVREVELYGSGQPTLSLFTDMLAEEGVDPDAIPVTLGTYPATDRGFRRLAAHGTRMSLRWTASAICSVQRVTLYIRETRQGAR